MKLALGVPLLLFAVLIAADGVARRGEDLQQYWTRCRQRVLSFLRQPLYIWSITLALVALAAVALLLARSGNDSGVGVSNFELHMRAMLEQWMYARPRTKEFAFGHPLFIFAMVAAARGYRLPACCCCWAPRWGRRMCLIPIAMRIPACCSRWCAPSMASGWASPSPPRCWRSSRGTR